MMGSVLLPSLYSRSLPYDFADLFTKEMVSIPHPLNVNWHSAFFWPVESSGSEDGPLLSLRPKRLISFYLLSQTTAITMRTCPPRIRDTWNRVV